MRRLLRFSLRNSRLFNLAYHRIKYPGASIAGSALLDVSGRLELRGSLAIGEGSNLIIPESTALIFGDGCRVGRHVELQPGACIELKDHVSLQDRCMILGDVRIGSHCLFAPNVYVSSGRHWHDLEPARYIKDQDALVARRAKAGDERSAPVVIEDDCWLGINAVIMRGVRIGKGSVVGANAVVTGDIEPYSVVAGAPARTIGKRLLFTPPAAIAHDAVDDLPYFYSGLETSAAELDKNAGLGGIATSGSFALCLDQGAGTTLVLLARMADGGAAMLRFEGQEQPVSGDWRELGFDIRDHQGDRFDFMLTGGSGIARMLVQRAGIR